MLGPRRIYRGADDLILFRHLCPITSKSIRKFWIRISLLSRKEKDNFSFVFFSSYFSSYKKSVREAFFYLWSLCRQQSTLFNLNKMKVINSTFWIIILLIIKTLNSNLHVCNTERTMVSLVLLREKLFV